MQKVLEQIQLTGTITAMEHSDCTIMFAMIGGTQVVHATLQRPTPLQPSASTLVSILALALTCIITLT